MTTTGVDELTEIFTKVTIAESPTAEVLELCKIPDSLNIEQIKEYITGYIASDKEYYLEKKCAINIDAGKSEWYTAKSTDGREIGAGSCAMDVITKNNEGIDVTCLIMNKKASNEKVLIQNFGVAGKNLDTLFKDKKDAEAVQLYGSAYLKKLQEVKEGKNLKELYILAFISTKKDVSLVCFKLNLENIKKISSGGFVKGPQGRLVNIIINNFINPSYGNVKLYKSKKRMELRLNIDVFKSEYAVKIYTMPEGSEGLVAQSAEPLVQRPHSPPVCTEQSQTSPEESDTNQESLENESTPEE